MMRLALIVASVWPLADGVYRRRRRSAVKDPETKWTLSTYNPPNGYSQGRITNQPLYV
jgi:hypothetical protein